MKDMDPGRVVFADRVADRVNGRSIYKSITHEQRLKERHNFARCAIDLLKAEAALQAADPDAKLPNKNQCSFYCHLSKGSLSKHRSQNPNGVLCSTLPKAAAKDTSYLARFSAAPLSPFQ